MIDQLQDWLNRAADAGTGVLSLGWGGRIYALPVRVRVENRVVVCRVPGWSDLADLAAEAEEVALVVLLAVEAPELCWLYVRGRGEVAEIDRLYREVRLHPQRAELVDERQGWGCRETLDLC